MSMLKGMYLEKCRQAHALLVDITGAPKQDGIYRVVSPHQDQVIGMASTLLKMCNDLRENET
jgi:hypothetical protein